MPDPTAKPVIIDEVRTEVKEDARLFFEGSYKRPRFNRWFPFEERYWPFSPNRYGEGEPLVNGVVMLFLIRSYDEKAGAFRFTISEPRRRITNDEHPSKTKAFAGFMLLQSDAAMADLLIPASAKDPLG